VSITIGLGGRTTVADLVLEHHRANFRPRVAVAPPPVDPAPAPARPRPGASVVHVLVIRGFACLVLWGMGGMIYGFWQLGNALVPTTSTRGVVTCVLTHGAGSIPGC
jgi:hypothetical protein